MPYFEQWSIILGSLRRMYKGGSLAKANGLHEGEVRWRQGINGVHDFGSGLACFFVK